MYPFYSTLVGIILFILSPIQGISQSYVIDQLNRTYGNCLQQTTDGNYTPVSTPDGALCMVISSPYSCCMDEGYTATFIKPHLGIVEEINVTPSEEAPQFTTTENAKVIATITKFSDTYVQMQPIATYEYYKNSDSSHMILSIGKKTYKSTPFTIPKVHTSGFCCTGDYASTVQCIRDLHEIKKVWLAPYYKGILVMYGYEAMGDGCDQGPFYEYLPLKSNKE